MTPESIAARFDVPGQVVTVLNIETGNVNDTITVGGVRMSDRSRMPESER